MRKITSFILIVLTSFTFFSFACSADENMNEHKTKLNENKLARTIRINEVIFLII